VSTALASKRGVHLYKVIGVKEGSGNINALGANAVHIKTTLSDVESPVVEATFLNRSSQQFVPYRNLLPKSV
jgi:hypothetical protein